MALSFSRMFTVFSLRHVCPMIIEENFQSFVLQITGKCICDSKNWIYLILLIPPSDTLSPRFLLSPTRQYKIIYFPQAAVFENIFSLEQKKRGNCETAEKVAKVKLVKVFVTISHTPCQIKIFTFIFCFLFFFQFFHLFLPLRY